MQESQKIKNMLVCTCLTRIQVHEITLIQATFFGFALPASEYFHKKLAFQNCFSKVFYEITSIVSN
jgi:hypothetical protein